MPGHRSFGKRRHACPCHAQLNNKQFGFKGPRSLHRRKAPRHNPRGDRFRRQGCSRRLLLLIGYQNLVLQLGLHSFILVRHASHPSHRRRGHVFERQLWTLIISQGSCGIPNHTVRFSHCSYLEIDGSNPKTGQMSEVNCSKLGSPSTYCRMHPSSIWNLTASVWQPTGGLHILSFNKACTATSLVLLCRFGSRFDHTSTICFFRTTTVRNAVAGPDDVVCYPTMRGCTSYVIWF